MILIGGRLPRGARMATATQGVCSGAQQASVQAPSADRPQAGVESNSTFAEGRQGLKPTQPRSHRRECGRRTEGLVSDLRGLSLGRTPINSLQ